MEENKEKCLNAGRVRLGSVRSYSASNVLTSAYTNMLTAMTPNRINMIPLRRSIMLMLVMLSIFVLLERYACFSQYSGGAGAIRERFFTMRKESITEVTSASAHDAAWLMYDNAP
jgi:hypothetical protein